MFKRVFLFCLILFVLFGMGVWQVQRFFYKQDLIASLGQSSKNISVSSSVSDLNKKLNYQIKVEGQFIPNKTIFWYSLQKNKMGYYLLVPFKMRDGTILVDLGWSKTKTDVNIKRGKHVLSGYLLGFSGPSKFVIDNDIKGRTWFRLDKDEIDNYFGYSIMPFVLKVSDKKYLEGGDLFVPKKITNNHVYYAVMWFSLAIIWVVFMFIYNRANKKNREK